jgi:CRISPR/Cas system CMR-associated protein Cmr5 small subunit
MGGAAASSVNAPRETDQIYVLDTRSGEIDMFAGVVQEHGLEKTVIIRNGKERTYDTVRIERIIWGEAQSHFRNGLERFERNDYENASAKFLVAATDEDERPPVRAAARLLAAQSFLNLSMQRPDRISDAIEQAQRYIDDYTNGASLPQAKALHARAKWLAGDAAGAAPLFRAIFQEARADGITPGYKLTPCLNAGLSAARAYLAVGETSPAREVFSKLEQRAKSELKELEELEEEDSTARYELLKLSLEARAGEGFALLAKKQAKKAITFFEGELSSATKKQSTLRYASLLGLGEAFLAEDRVREAQLKFAEVSSLDHTDRDRVARALFRLAESTQDLADPNSTGTVKAWLESIVNDYGDTLWANPAREHLESM